ncbi:MAG: ATP-grasp domain-containing protein [Bacteroidia bacterium]
MRILIINIGWEQEPLIDSCFQISGAEVYAVHYNSLGYRHDEYKKVLVTDLLDLQKILDFAAEVQPEMVVSDQCDYSHVAQAMVAEKYNLPGPRINTAQISANKWLQREKAKAGGVLIPDFRMTLSSEEGKTAAREIGYPVILKPADNRGSFGVGVANSEAELADAWFQAFANSHSRMVMVEQFIKGYEITVDGYIFDGVPRSLSLARKTHVSNTTRVAVDIKYPGDMPEDVYNAAMRNNEKVASALGYSFGMIHSEYIIEDGSNDIYLVESANRGGGVYTSEIIVPAVSGVDVLKALVNDASGNAPYAMPGQVKANQVILKFFKFDPGHVLDILGLDQLDQDPQVLKYRLLIQKGHRISPISNDGNRHGFIIATHESDVRKKAEQIFNQITIQYAES